MGRKYRSLAGFLHSEIIEEMKHLNIEKGFILLLNDSGEALFLDNTVTMGKENIVFMKAISEIAQMVKRYPGFYKMVLVHNHPNTKKVQDLFPSIDDLMCAEKFFTEAKDYSLVLDDSLIISKVGIFSFKKAGLFA